MLIKEWQSKQLEDAERRRHAGMPDTVIPPFPHRRTRPRCSGRRVDSMIEGLEEIKIPESRTRYQLEKLVRISDDASKASTTTPWPSDLTLKTWPTTTKPRTKQNAGGKHSPHSFTKIRRGRTSSLPLAWIVPAAFEIQRMTEFEEDDFSRLMMKRKDARRRQRDEEVLAFGEMGFSHEYHFIKPARMTSIISHKYVTVASAGSKKYAQSRDQGNDVSTTPSSYLPCTAFSLIR
ncbi:hypothetical protein OG21DRAFT_1487302 [Imleria badia]|nr:hypothetical protein OG21DRAFT_1487302 [Imleria badia]